MNLTKRRNIVARILAAENRSDAVAAEAKRAGTSTRTIERWIAAANKALGETASPVGQPVLSENGSPLEKKAENTVLDTLLKGDGQPGKPAAGPITPGEIQAAGKDQEDFCLQAYSGVKSAVGSVLVSVRYTPPLDGSSPEVLKLLQVGTTAALAIRANAPRIYPILVKYAGTWGALLGALAVDALGMMMGLEGTAKAAGWKPEPKKAADRPAPSAVPTMQAYSEQLRPPSTSTGTSGEAESKPVVINAPIPTPEQLATAGAIREVLVG